MATFEILRADITTLAVDAIVNAANSSLLGGGGVDGAIHRAAGRELLAFCRGLNGCKPGQAKLSPGFNLPAKHIIHTVGPIWHGGRQGEAVTLANCYRACLAIAAAQKFATIAFPAISTGVYRYPLQQACRVAVETCRAALQGQDYPQKVIFVCFSAEAEEGYARALAEIN